MILSDKQLKLAMASGKINIEPFFDSIGSNSIDLHLSPFLFQYNDTILDSAQENKGFHSIIGKEGMILKPGELYLGSTLESTTSGVYVPLLEGKSSIGRLGICVHITAGVGDIGFVGHWTLEISVVKPVRVYAGMPVAQLMYFVAGECDTPYHKKSDAKYSGQIGRPVASAMHKNFPLSNTILNYVDSLI